MAPTSPQPKPASVEEPTSSRLLKLPGELRNRIYRLAIVEEVRITSNTASFPEPPLLSVCKEIRAEASSIFYGEVRFITNVNAYNSTLFMAVMNKLQAVRRSNQYLGTTKWGVMIDNVPNWHNLESWLQKGHTRNGVGMLLTGPSDGASQQHKLVSALHAMVGGLLDLPWDRVQPLLQAFRRSLIAIDGGWAE